jgi:hypothetical protein
MCVGPIGETGPLSKTVALRLLQHLLDGAEAPSLQTPAVEGEGLLSAEALAKAVSPRLEEEAEASSLQAPEDVPF